MKKLILILFAMLIATQAYSQSYYKLKMIGTENDYNIKTSGTVVIPSTADQFLSDAITLPFTWKFFGQDVNQLKVSDNGYITFDVSETISDTGNVVLPSVTAPKNAIFAMWDDLEFKPISASFETDAKYFVYGTAPKRVFVIQWVNVSLIGYPANISHLSFAIRLHEGGDFDIVYNNGTPITSTKVNATIGCQNADGTVGFQVDGSPDLTFPNPVGVQSNSTDMLYVFKYGSQKTYDLEMSTLQAPEIVSKGTPVSFTANLTNWGSEDITTFDFNYSIENGTPITQSITNKTVQGSGGSLIFVDSNCWTPSKSGDFYRIKAWVSNLNGHADENPANDTNYTTVFVNTGVTAPKSVFLEEGSGCWCGFCPDGHLYMRDILANHKNVIGVVHHNGDGMVVAEGDSLNTIYAPGYPYGMVDRTLFTGETGVGIMRDQWESRVIQQLNASTPASVTIDRTFDPVTRKIDFTVNVKFYDYAIGDFRINAFIIEDKVRGEDGPDFTQHSYYSHETTQPAGGTTHELYPEPEYFIGYFHNHVVRSILTGVWGDVGIIPAQTSPDQTYTKNYSYILPAEIPVSYATPGINTKFQSTDPGIGRNKANDTKIVAFVVNYSDDKNHCDILNVAEMPFGEVGVNENTNPVTSTDLSIYPNPAYGISTIEFSTPVLTHATVDIFNYLGQKIQSVKEANFIQGTHYLAFNADVIQNGTYFVIIKTDKETITKSFVIEK